MFDDYVGVRCLFLCLIATLVRAVLSWFDCYVCACCLVLYLIVTLVCAVLSCV